MKYQIIYADPPWQYKDKSKSHGGGAESHYPTMSLEQICELPISTIADDNAVLLLWVTMPFLPEGLKVMESWGFKYKTCAFTWVKTNKDGSIYMGMGRYTRANAEICLLGTKGKGLPRQNASVKNTHLFPRSRHSEKPREFRWMIETLFATYKSQTSIEPPAVELFARQKTEGWDVWGNELENDINL